MLVFSFILPSCACNKGKNKKCENDANKEELLMGRWKKVGLKNGSGGLKTDLEWRFNKDKTDSIIDVFIAEGNAKPDTTIVYGTWEVIGDSVVCTNSRGEKTFWHIMKLTKDSLKLEYYDAQPKRFESEFYRINVQNE